MKIALIGDSLTEGRPGVSFFNILKEKFPNVAFMNLGKPGETVQSLHSRLLKMKMDPDYDLAFLWIGVNDVYSKLLKVQAQPVVKNMNEFKEYYEKVLELVVESSKKVVTIGPAIVSENPEHESKHEIKEINRIIESITRNYENTSFTDMRSVFINHLKTIRTSDYLNLKVMRVMADVLFYKSPSQVDKVSKKRNLHLTLDGIHLNSRGAEMVAEVYAKEIRLVSEAI